MSTLEYKLKSVFPNSIHIGNLNYDLNVTYRTSIGIIMILKMSDRVKIK
jgi:hypothetical protein